MCTQLVELKCPCCDGWSFVPCLVNSCESTSCLTWALDTHNQSSASALMKLYDHHHHHHQSDKINVV